MATNGIFSGDLTDGNEDEIEELEAQDDGVRSSPAVTYACKRNGSTHFRGPGPICDTAEYCTFCDGARTSLPPDEKQWGEDLGPLPTEEDFEQLRASVPPTPKYDGPKLYRETHGEPVGPWDGNPRVRPFNGCAPGSHDDFDELEHARAVADVANDLRSRGARVSIPRQRRTRVRDRFLRWVFSVAEDALEDLAERFIEAKMRLDVGVEDLDPWPEPLVPGFGDGRWTTPIDLEHPEYEEEIPFANREYCGIFARGGLGR